MRHYLKNFFKIHSFFSIYLFVLIPVFILAISQCIAFVFNYTSYKNLLTKNYVYNLETLNNENMSLLQNITSFAYSLSGNEDFMDYLTLEDPVPIDDLRLENQVKLLSDLHQFIDSMLIIKRVDDGFVIVDNEIYPMVEYLDSTYKYDNYPANYWQSYSPPIQGVDFLMPTTVSSTDGNKYIYPIVYSKIGSKSLGSTLFVINIDMRKMAQSVDQKLTNNTGIVFINNNNNSIYNAESGLISDPDPSLINKLTAKTVNYFYCKIDSQRYYTVSLYQKNSPFGYSYAMTLPASDLMGVHGTILIISILLLLASIFIAFLLSKKLFDPWKLLASTLNTSPASSTDANSIDLICNEITDLIRDKSSITDEYAKALPLAQERYIINILNSPNEYTSDGNEFVDFRYDYFCSIVIKLRPTDHFNDEYTSEDYNKIQTGIYSIIQAMFAEMFDSFAIPSENNTLYILLNLPDDKSMDKIFDIAQSFQNLFEQDKKCINLHIGIGLILKGMEGMKMSHRQAMSMISAIPGINTTQITRENDSEKVKDQAISTILDFNAENSIYNNLIIGNVKKARSYILDLFDNNRDILSDRQVLTQFYMQIFNIIFKAMKAKNISYGEEGANDLDTLLSILSNTSLEIHETMLSMLDQLETIVPVAGTKADINEILDYINNHYMEDMYLDGLSEQFGISPSYLSKLIKDHSGMNFVSYLASLRIEMAKKLLLETKMSITEIYEKCGFNNRTTFIRTFKKTIGLPPSDFRKLNMK